MPPPVRPPLTFMPASRDHPIHHPLTPTPPPPPNTHAYCPPLGQLSSARCLDARVRGIGHRRTHTQPLRFPSLSPPLLTHKAVSRCKSSSAEAVTGVADVTSTRSSHGRSCIMSSKALSNAGTLGGTIAGPSPASACPGQEATRTQVPHHATRYGYYKQVSIRASTHTQSCYRMRGCSTQSPRPPFSVLW
jgi:hypothetical protein